MPTTPSTRPATRRRILDAAFAVWRSQPPADLFGGITVSSVARQAGVTRATFYSYWPSTAAYLEDLVELLAELDPQGYGPGVGPSIDRLGAARRAIRPDFHEASRRQLASVVDDPAFPVRLGLLSRADDPTVAAGLRRRYREVEERAGGPYERIRATWGREVRPPLTTDQVRAVYSCLLEGLAMRHLVDPEVIPLELHGSLALGLTMLVTRRIDDPRSLDDLLAGADTWPAVGMRLRAVEPGGPPPHTVPMLDPGTARAVIEEARRLQGAMGWHELTLGDIGGVTRLSEESLLRAFGSKAGLGLLIFLRSVDERFQALELTGDPAVDLRRMIGVAAGELRRSPAITQHVAQVLVGSATSPTPELIDRSPMQVLEVEVAAAIDAGLLDAELDPTAFVRGLAQVVVMESALPVASATGPTTVELVLRGAGLPVRHDPPLTPTAPAGADTGAPGVPVPAEDPFLG